MIIGKNHGKTALGKKLTDAWLIDHPYKKAHILDTKDRTKDTIRWFEPHKQIPQKKQ